MKARHAAANAARFLGGAEVYDHCRPAPPRILTDLLPALARRRPRLIVDLGSGTGLSTRPWARCASRVIGVEPNADMRARAIAATAAKNVVYREGYSHDTGLAPASVDILVCAQALHWMEPAPTWREIARIVRPGGVVAIIHAEMPPIIDFGLRDAFGVVRAKAIAYDRRHRLDPDERKWSKAEHDAARRRVGRFLPEWEFGLHDVDRGDAERLAGLAKSLGDVLKAQKNGATDHELGIDALRRAAMRVMPRPVAWVWSFAAVLTIRRYSP